METGTRIALASLIIASVFHAEPTRPAYAQAAPGANPAPHTHPQSGMTGAAGGQDLASQMMQLKHQMDQIQAVMSQHGAPQLIASSVPAPAMGMDGMGAMGAGGGMMGMGGCAMMAQMATGGGPLLSGLPGFPGASHLYHVGSTGFFLDHPQHITLTPDQVARLGKLRDEAIAAQAETRRKLDAAESELWQLTGSDQPQLSAIEAKAREIEKLRADERIAFIRAVGQAARVLTDDQRKALLGQMPPMPNPAAGMQPMQQPPGGMGAGMMDDSMEMPPMGGGASSGTMPSGSMGDM